MSQEPSSSSHPPQADASGNADNKSSDESGNFQFWVVDDRRPQPEEVPDWIHLPMHKTVPSTVDSPNGLTNIVVLHVPTLKKTIQNYQLGYWLDQVQNMPPEEPTNDDGVLADEDGVLIVPETPPPFYDDESVVPENPALAASPATCDDLFSQSSYKTAAEDSGFDIEHNGTEPASVSEELSEQSEGPLSPSSEVAGSLSWNDGPDSSVDDKCKMKTEKNLKRQREWPYGCYGCGRRFAKSSTFMKHYRKYPKHHNPNATVPADKPTTPASELPPIDPVAELRRLLGYDPLSMLSAALLPSAL